MATPDDLDGLADSWAVHLRAERKSPKTIKTYRDGVRAFLRWCDGTGTAPMLDKHTVTTFVAALLDSGAADTTAHSRYASLKRFSAWLTAEGEFDTDPLLGLKPPKLDRRVVPELTTEQLKALISACEGKSFVDRRDEALVRFMVETAVRAGEVVAMELADIDVRDGMAVVHRGKGGKGRRVPFGPQTARAIDRYLRLRRAHRLADSPALWLGGGGKNLGYAGLHKALCLRAKAAGIDGFTPHWLRHTAAGRWLAAGGTEQGLMAVAGWSGRDMIDRYTGSTSQRRAAEEARRLNLGDL